MTGTVIEKLLTTSFALNGTAHAQCHLVVEVNMPVINKLGRMDILVSAAVFANTPLGAEYSTP